MSGFPAFAIAVFLDRRKFVESLPVDLHPEYRAEVLRVLAAVALAGEQWQDFRVSMAADAAARGRTAVPFEPEPEESWMTTDEAAEVLGVSANRVRQLVRADVLPGRKVGGRYLVEASAVELRAAS